jgi:hypothetical protein
MEEHNRIDDELRTLVRSAEREIPLSLEERMRTAADSPQPLPRRRFFPSPLLALTSAIGATVLLLAIVFMIPSLRRSETPQITEIRTEFVIPDKSITIIFVQKPDFPVFVTAF